MIRYTPSYYDFNGVIVQIGSPILNDEAINYLVPVLKTRIKKLNSLKAELAIASKRPSIRWRLVSVHQRAKRVFYGFVKRRRIPALYFQISRVVIEVYAELHLRSSA